MNIVTAAKSFAILSSFYLPPAPEATKSDAQESSIVQTAGVDRSFLLTAVPLLLAVAGLKAGASRYVKSQVSKSLKAFDSLLSLAGDERTFSLEQARSFYSNADEPREKIITSIQKLTDTRFAEFTGLSADLFFKENGNYLSHEELEARKKSVDSATLRITVKNTILFSDSLRQLHKDAPEVASRLISNLTDEVESCACKLCEKLESLNEIPDAGIQLGKRKVFSKTCRDVARRFGDCSPESALLFEDIATLADRAPGGSSKLLQLLEMSQILKSTLATVVLSSADIAASPLEIHSEISSIIQSQLALAVCSSANAVALAPHIVKRILAHCNAAEKSLLEISGNTEINAAELLSEIITLTHFLDRSTALPPISEEL